jgi:hypothetical protein
MIVDLTENSFRSFSTSILKDLDPRTTSVVINCGMVSHAFNRLSI